MFYVKIILSIITTSLIKLHTLSKSNIIYFPNIADSMKPICLPVTPELQTEKLEGLQGVVAGWGATEDGLQSPVLLSVDLPIITNNDCQTIYNG